MAIIINDNSARAQYTATSGQTVFTVPFEFFANADLAVYQNSTLKTLTTHYTVTGAGVTGGGSITLVTGATVGDVITIVRDIAVARITDFPTSGPFVINDLNTDLDRLTAMIQQQETKLARTLRLDDFDTPSTFSVLPAKSTRASKVLSFDTNGNPSATITATEVANAQTYATNAAASATSASSSASSATSSASSATSSASSATTSASSASTSASAASTSASNASTSASGASTSATNAATSASAASTSAINAASSATAASSSANSASAAQIAAESARDATLASYDSFDDRYLGPKASDPTLDNDGNALLAGTLYFDSVNGIMKIYTGTVWVAAYVSGVGFVSQTSATGAAQIPASTTANRPTPVTGQFRFNTTLTQFEGYNGSAWGAVGGGATGGVGNNAFYENDKTVSVNYTITTNKNAGSFGPITVNGGITVTVPSGSTWSIV